MNHQPQLHIERLAHDHHAELMSNAAARRSTRTTDADHRVGVERRTSRAVRPCLIASIGVAVAGLFTAASGGTAEASGLAQHVCEVPDVPSAERAFGRFLRAV